MTKLIPAFDARSVFITPWTTDFGNTGWIVLMAFLVTLACGVVGQFLVLRRMALMGDAISHTSLLGLVGGYLLFHSRNLWVMVLGALVIGLLTAWLVEVIHKTTRVKQDAAIGITFTTLFAIGALLVALLPGNVHIDAECILYGEIAYVPLEPKMSFMEFLRGAHDSAAITAVSAATQVPAFRLPLSIWETLIVTLVIGVLVVLFYKELLVTCFDPGLAASLGISVTTMHYSLMAATALVLVASFQAVGAILVIAMLILPGVTAGQLSSRLPINFGLIAFFAMASAFLGFHLATALNCSIAAAVVVAGSGLFTLVWLFAPQKGLLVSGRLLSRNNTPSENPATSVPS